MMRRRILRIGAVVVALAAAGGAAGAWARGDREAPSQDEPAKQVRHRLSHADHAALVRGPFADGPAVTRDCLRCHPDAARQVMATAHWTWLGPEVKVPGHPQPLRIGKKNLINNFCIGVQPNLTHCTECHAGYGWVDSTFDFSDASRVDCLVCHDTTGTYRKDPDKGGIVAEDVNLLNVARSVGAPRRGNCGTCHFAGGGGDAVKHGDLDGTMYFPPERIDAHMGKYNFVCQDCHRTQHHAIPGRSMSVSVDNANRVACSDCHASAPHKDDRLNAHTNTVACQTCHIPQMAVEAPTKMTWDWSTAGQDRPDADPHEYLKIKGSFTYARQVTPRYAWYNGTADRYLKGDKIDPSKVTQINYPRGSIRDPQARIWPFKVHSGKQIYDAEYNYLLIPKTYGEGGFWTQFDWQKAAQLGAEASGMKYSGKYGFARTEMWWPLSHMVATKDKALQCTDCHADNGRMNWTELGYDGDPALRGGRRLAREGRP